MTDLLARLKGVVRSGNGWTARCPAHDDQHNSLSVAHGDGRLLVKCHAGCRLQGITDALGITAADLFDRVGGRGAPHSTTAQPRNHPPDRRSQASLGRDAASSHHEAAGLSLDDYARAKGLPVDFLRSLGLSQFTYNGKPAVRIPYFGIGGEEIGVRFRIGLEGDRFRWKSGSKPCLFGLDRLADARKAGMVVLVEGESDCHTLWFHGIPALGIPGAANWREERDASHLEGIGTIYVVIEPDRGGDTVRQWLSRSTIRDRVKLISLPAKDPSALHLEDPDAFPQQLQLACQGAVAWIAVEAEANAEERTEAWAKCSGLAGKPNILDEFASDLSQVGVVGERRGAKLLYLALTSRLLDRPVAVAVKGPSSGGKSFIVESTLKFFPAAAFYALTAMSDRALAYSDEPLKHRHLVIYEAAGMTSEFATYLIRSLLSEGRVRYETVEKTKDGLESRLIEREGPTGLIVTTTSLRLNPENETRMLSLTITDTPDQTAAVFRALAQESDRAEVDLTRWHALQTWLAGGSNEVVIPFAKRLAELLPPVAIRLRRDFKTILMLIRAHALLHQASRRRDEGNRVIATVEDYAAVRDLVADLVAEGVEVTVKPEIREVVEAVARLLRHGEGEVRQVDLQTVLPLGKSAMSRRIAGALDAGFLRNLEERKGRPARLVLGDALPADLEILPTPDRFTIVEGLRGCGVERGDTPPPPPDAHQALEACDLLEPAVANTRWSRRI